MFHGLLWVSGSYFEPHGIVPLLTRWCLDPDPISVQQWPWHGNGIAVLCVSCVVLIRVYQVLLGFYILRPSYRNSVNELTGGVSTGVPGVALAPSEIWFPLNLTADRFNRLSLIELCVHLPILLFTWPLHGFRYGKLKLFLIVNSSLDCLNTTRLPYTFACSCKFAELFLPDFATHIWKNALLMNRTDVLQSVIVCIWCLNWQRFICKCRDSFQWLASWVL